MKPIQVNNQEEWATLASVLGKYFKYWIDGTSFNEWHPVGSRAYQYPIWVGSSFQNKLEMIPEYALVGKVQTVDEYLEAKSLEIEAVKPAPFTIDYKALYEAQTIVIAEAIAKMENKKNNLLSYGSNYGNDKAEGIEYSIDTLKEKLKL